MQTAHPVTATRVIVDFPQGSDQGGVLWQAETGGDFALRQATAGHVSFVDFHGDIGTQGNIKLR